MNNGQNGSYPGQRSRSRTWIADLHERRIWPVTGNLMYEYANQELRRNCNGVQKGQMTK